MLTKFQEWVVYNLRSVMRVQGYAMKKYRELHPGLSEEEARHGLERELGELMMDRFRRKR